MASNVTKKPEGCHHYKRKCTIVSPCCDKVYACRFCHDDKENHTINRKLIVEIVCSMCNLRQYVQKECKRCQTRFGSYSCLACNFFEDSDRKQFHCCGCGICRVGGRANYFHCYKCGMCIPIANINTHKCSEDSSYDECPICLDNIHDSRHVTHLLKCGHYLHLSCYEELVANNIKKCTLCRKDM